MSHRKTHERMIEAQNQRGRTYLRPVGPDRYFWRHVVQDGDCWLWTGILNWLGYGYVARQPEPGSPSRAAATSFGSWLTATPTKTSSGRSLPAWNSTTSAGTGRA